MSASLSFIRTKGLICLRGQLPQRLLASTCTVILQTGDRRLFIESTADGAYDFTFASRRRLLWVVVSTADARGRLRPLRRLLIWNNPASTPQAITDPIPTAVSESFEKDVYLKALPRRQQTAAKADPLRHYLTIGWHQRTPPHRWFDVEWYLQENPTVAAHGEEPFTHYLLSGWKQDRSPHPGFDNTHYLARHPELMLGEMSPLQHWSLHPSDDSVTPYWSRSVDAPSHFPRARPHRIPATAQLHSLIETYVQTRRSNNTTAVFTIIIGDYDTLRLPEHLSPDIDYFVFTDQPVTGYGVFDVRPLPAMDGDSSPARLARYLKLNPQLWFSEYDVVIHVDANVIIRGDLAPHIRSFVDSKKPLAVLPHPVRDCLYEEAVICVAAGRDCPERIVPQMLAYRQAGYPEHHGLIEGNLYACRPAQSQTQVFFESWWQQFDQGSQRDQLSANYVLWKMNLVPHLFLGPGANTRNHPDFALVDHGNYDAPAYAGLDAVWRT